TGCRNGPRGGAPEPPRWRGRRPRLPPAGPIQRVPSPRERGSLRAAAAESKERNHHASGANGRAFPRVGEGRPEPRRLPPEWRPLGDYEGDGADRWATERRPSSTSHSRRQSGRVPGLEMLAAESPILPV